jgi:hypothetical protein
LRVILGGRLTLHIYMEAFVNTSVMVRPAQVTPCGKQAAGSWIILTLRIFI